MVDAETLILNVENTQTIRLTDSSIKTLLVSGQDVVVPLGRFDLTDVSGLEIAQTYIDGLAHYQ